jgi:hypothetical protein
MQTGNANREVRIASLEVKDSPVAVQSAGFDFAILRIASEMLQENTQL